MRIWFEALVAHTLTALLLPFAFVGLVVGLIVRAVRGGYRAAGPVLEWRGRAVEAEVAREEKHRRRST